MADNFEVIKCPACQKEMVKVFVPREGVNVDICVNGCGGIYFDNREFKYFDEQYENIEEIIEALSNKTFIEVREDYPRTCPVCGARMVKNFSSMKREIQVDECYTCGGKFLDEGELVKIREEFATEKERIEDTMAYVHSVVGKELKELEQKWAEGRANRSVLKKLFDKMIGLD